MPLTEVQKNTIEFLKKYNACYIKNPEKVLFGKCLKKENFYLIITSNKEFKFTSIEEMIKNGWILD